jgi:Ulp1 protease family, C-terminal catalytic domain
MEQIEIVGGNVTSDASTNKDSDGKFKSVSCAPRDQTDPDITETNDYSCYSSKSLEKLKTLWNKRHPDQKIEDTDPRAIWAALKNNMNRVCHQEACWLRQSFATSGMDKEMLHYTFAPQAPKEWKKDIHEWLSSIDIANSLKQYEHAVPSFLFIGPSPVDFDEVLEDGECVWNELCKFDIMKHVKNGKYKIGVVFNTDPHDKPGEHWVSLFIDVRAKVIFFFDSTGDKPQRRIRKFMKMVREQGDANGIPFKEYINDIHHQSNDSECGVYCIFMIIHMLLGKMTVHDFLDKKKKLTDKYMQRFRRKFFNVDENVPTPNVEF